MKIFSLMKATRKKYGYIASQKVLLARLLEKFLLLTGIESVLLRIDRMNIDTKIPQEFEVRFLTEEEIEKFSRDPENDLSDVMKGRIAGGNDFCYAALQNGRLAAYGWYALNDIEGMHNYGIPMAFPNQFAYMYKGFTHPDFRGKRLHGLLMGNSLLELNKKFGIEALISTVTWTNFASLASCKKLGYELLGRIWTAREGQQILSKPSRLRKLGVEINVDVKSHVRDHQQVENRIASDSKPNSKV